MKDTCPSCFCHCSDSTPEAKPATDTAIESEAQLAADEVKAATARRADIERQWSKLDTELEEALKDSRQQKEHLKQAWESHTAAMERFDDSPTDETLAAADASGHALDEADVQASKAAFRLRMLVKQKQSLVRQHALVSKQLAASESRLRSALDQIPVPF